MGVEESKHVKNNISVVNTDIKGTRQLKRRGKPMQEPPPSPKSPSDAFFRHVDIGDHIQPVYGTDEEKKEEEEKETVEGAFNLTQLLDELGGPKKPQLSEEEDDDLYELPQYEDKEGDDEDDAEDEDRGKFHHDVDVEGKTDLDIFSGVAHPLTVKGECCVDETLICKDASEWSNQFPLYKVQWFIGSEVGNQVSFQVFPNGDGFSFSIPPSSVGRYIQVVGTRRVEEQVKAGRRAEDEGVYDPHVQTRRNAEKGLERRFVDVDSTAVVGPVLISDSWAFTITHALSEAEFSCIVKLRDRLAKGDTDQHVKVEGHKSVVKIPATLVINKSMLELTYAAAEGNHTKKLKWLSGLAGDKTKDGKNQEKDSLGGEVTARMKLKTITFRPSASKSSIIIATQVRKEGLTHTKEVQDLIRFDVDSELGRDVLLFICIGFQFSAKMKLADPRLWKQAYDNGDVEQAKDLIQKYMEEASIAAESRPAYEEIPMNPWEA